MKKNLSIVKTKAFSRQKSPWQKVAKRWIPLMALLAIFNISATRANAQDDAAKKVVASQIVTRINSMQPQIDFIPNMGQYDNTDILYTAKAPFGHYTLTPKGLIMGVYDVESVKAIADYANKTEDRNTGDEYRRTHVEPTLKGTGILLQYWL